MQEVVAIVVFLVVIVAIMTEKVHRTAAALAGSVLLLLTGVLDVEAAVGYIDFNTIGVLIGMMLFVAVVKNSGLFEYVAIKAAKMAKGDPWKIMVAFIVITAFLSGFLDNVTTVLLVGPMTITIARMLKVNPVPFLLTQIFAAISAVRPPSSATRLHHDRQRCRPDVPGFRRQHRRGSHRCHRRSDRNHEVRLRTKLSADAEAIKAVAELDETKAIEDRVLLTKSIVMVIIVVFAFIFHSQLGMETATIALTCAAVMMVIASRISIMWSAKSSGLRSSSSSLSSP